VKPGHQDGGAASVASHAVGVLFGPPDLCRNLGRKEARQIAGRPFLGDRPGKEIASPDERQGKNGGHHKD
jgi:hypothetical protein